MVKKESEHTISLFPTFGLTWLAPLFSRPNYAMLVSKLIIHPNFQTQKVTNEAFGQIGWSPTRMKPILAFSQ